MHGKAPSLTGNKLPLQHDISWYFQVVVNKIKEHANNLKFPMNICFEMRFMGQSNSLLCPAVVGQRSPNGSIKTAYIEVLTLVDTPGWKDFCTEIATVRLLLW